jgi:probable rRNA maturation factor
VKKLQLSIHVEKPFVNLVDKGWLRWAVKLTLAQSGTTSDIELSLVIAGDDTVHELNKNYRGVDRTTDVIAFALSQANGKEADRFVMPPDDSIHLGEVIVSYPQAKRQANEHYHSIEHELALLVTHGVLHLLGYDHELPEDKKEMRALEAKVLSAIAA